MKKILIPIDGSERSKMSVDLLKKLFEPGDIYLVIFIVKEEIDLGLYVFGKKSRIRLQNLRFF